MENLYVSRSCSGRTRCTSSGPGRPHHRPGIDRWPIGQHSSWSGWRRKYPSRGWTLVIPRSLVGRILDWSPPTPAISKRTDLRHIPLVPPSIYLFVCLLCVHNDVSFICLVLYIIIIKNACHFGEEFSWLVNNFLPPLVDRVDRVRGNFIEFGNSRAEIIIPRIIEHGCYRERSNEHCFVNFNCTGLK